VPYCKNCGTETNKTDKFCSKCGFKLFSEQQNETSGKELQTGQEHQKVLTPKAFARFLCMETRAIALETRQNLEKHFIIMNKNNHVKVSISAAAHSKLPKVEEELFFFFVFALEHWWTMDSHRTQEERRIGRQAFEAHLANVVSMDTLQERLIAYAQIVNEETIIDAKFLGFGMKIQEFCGVPHALFIMLAQDLFLEAEDSIERLRSVRLKLR